MEWPLETCVWHLLFTEIEEGTYQIEQLQITNPEVIPHGVRCEGLLRVLSWVSFDLPDHHKRTLSTLLQAAGEGCLSLHTVPIEGRDIRDDPITEHALKITSPTEQLPPATKTLNFLGRSFNVLSIGNNPVSQAFVVTGIIIAQGEFSHHFLIIERCHKDKVLIYDNLQGHKWIPTEQLTATSVVWGFIFRQQDHQSYSFQPKQYKAIAPDTLTTNQQTHGHKQLKVKQKKIPLGSMPEDTIFPSSQRRSQEMTLPQLILWKSRNKNKLISQLKFRH